MNGKKQKGHISRRNLLKFSAGALGTGVMTAGLGAKLVSGQPTVAKNDLTSEQALQTLIEGNQRFIKRKSRNPSQNYARFLEVAKGQKPFASLLSCADSRVPSEIIFDQGFGDLFVCRVAGNVATPEEIGSLEFGSLVLGSKVIMVMGHKRCGAVDATLKGAQVPGQIGSLLDAIKPAVESVQGEGSNRLENAAKANVLYQTEKVKSSPVISKLIKEGKLKVVGAYYDLDTAKVTILS